MQWYRSPDVSSLVITGGSHNNRYVVEGTAGGTQRRQ